MVRVLPLQTGTVFMKAARRRGRPGRSALGRALDALRDPTWDGPLPILAWLVEHPEGRFVVDTGDTCQQSAPGYLPWWHPLLARQAVVKVAPREEVGPRLHARGVDPARDVRAVVLTHFHHDHTGGLHHFPHTPVVAPRAGWAAATGVRGRLTGCLPQRWPVWFQPDLVDLNGPPVGPFPASYPLTEDGRVFLVPTPGHAAGHVSVVVRGDGVTYFLAGDAAYSEDDLRHGRVDGVTRDPAASLATLRAIRRFAEAEPTIVLPAHDPDGPWRLAMGARYTRPRRDPWGAGARRASAGGPSAREPLEDGRPPVELGEVIGAE